MVMFIRFDHMLIDRMKECDSVVKNYKRTTCNSGLEAAYTILYFIVYIQCCVGCAAVDDIVV